MAAVATSAQYQYLQQTLDIADCLNGAHLHVVRHGRMHNCMHAAKYTSCELYACTRLLIQGDKAPLALQSMQHTCSCNSLSYGQTMPGIIHVCTFLYCALQPKSWYVLRPLFIPPSSAWPACPYSQGSLFGCYLSNTQLPQRHRTRGIMCDHCSSSRSVDHSCAHPAEASMLTLPPTLSFVSRS